MKKAIYAGTFDLFTNGHADILQRALKLFDQIVVLIAVPPDKKATFSKEERREMLEELFANEPKVKIDTWDGLLVDYAKKNKINVIVRGLRPTGDFEPEFRMATMNSNLFPGLETIFLMASADNYYIASNSVKEVLSFGGDISKFVPPVILKYIKNKRV